MKKFNFFLTTLFTAVMLMGSTSVWGQYSGTGTFTKITSVDDLTDGYYVITNETDAFVMTNGRSGSATTGYFVSAAITPVAGVITNPVAANVWKIEINGSGRTIYNEAIAKYVGWISGNAASIEDTPADSNRWTFTYDSNKFTVNNVATTARQLSYNSQNPRFAAYANAGQEELQLYKMETSSCTASNLAFADPTTVNKSVVDSKFTIAATSLNGTTDIVYSSTNPSVATVDAETGEVTIVGAGTTKIKANQAAGTHSGTDYCVGSAEYDLTVDPLEAPVATAATNAWKTRFFANWNAVTGATSYELNVYTKEGGANASDLFISEYVEGSSNNKYIEIYNGTGAAVDLSDYKLQLFANGVSTPPTNDVELEGTLAHGATKVYKNSSASLSLPSGVTADANNACNFNGDDAIALYKVSTSSYVDIFGRIGNDPGTAWTGSGDYTTVDKTLVRKSSVLGGITTSPTGTGAGAFTTLTTEWDMYGTDVVSNLGTHTFDGSETITPISGSPFTVSGGGTNTYEVTGLTPKVQYYYTVKAKNGSFESAESNEVSAMIDMDTGVNNTAALSGISVQNGNLTVSATAGTLIEVYNIAGQKIVSQTAKEGVNTIAIAQRGAMIVKIGTETVKVVI